MTGAAFNQPELSRNLGSEAARPTFGVVALDDYETEKRLLGLLFFEPSSYRNVRALLAPDDFVTERHQRIFAAIGDVQERGDTVSPVTVLQDLRHRGLDDEKLSAYLVMLVATLVTKGNAEAEARHLWKARRGIPDQTIEDAARVAKEIPALSSRAAAKLEKAAGRTVSITAFFVGVNVVLTLVATDTVFSKFAPSLDWIGWNRETAILAAAAAAAAVGATIVSRLTMSLWRSNLERLELRRSVREDRTRISRALAG